jgi:hypothetical protein
MVISYIHSICGHIKSTFYEHQHARGRIENWHRDRERDEQEQRDEKDYGYYGPYYQQPHRQCFLEGGHIPGGMKAYS